MENKSDNEMMTTPTKASKPLAFDIDIVPMASPSGKSAIKVKERLEQRKRQLETSDEKMSPSLEQLNEKLANANEKKKKTFEDKTK